MQSVYMRERRGCIPDPLLSYHTSFKRNHPTIISNTFPFRWQDELLLRYMQTFFDITGTAYTINAKPLSCNKHDYSDTPAVHQVYAMSWYVRLFLNHMAIVIVTKCCYNLPLSLTALLYDGACRCSLFPARRIGPLYWCC